MSKSNKRKRQAAPPPAENPPQRAIDPLRASANYVAPKDGTPRDRDVVRMVLARRLMEVMGLPRRCGEPLCRRARRCVGPTLRCQRDVALPPVSEDKGAAAMAHFRKLLTREMERRGKL